MDCYCEHMRETEEGRNILREENVPDGFCGWCDGVEDVVSCNKPGHVRPYPGPVPCTGCWCDECYEIEAAHFREMEAKEAAKKAFIWYLILAGLPIVVVFTYVTIAHFMGWGWK